MRLLVALILLMMLGILSTLVLDYWPGLLRPLAPGAAKTTGDAATHVEAEDSEMADVEPVVKQMNRGSAELHYNGAAFRDVIDEFREKLDLNIFVNWKELERAGIESKSPVTADFHGRTYSEALLEILGRLSPDHRLDYEIDFGVVTISTRADLNKNRITRVYDARNLLPSAGPERTQRVNGLVRMIIDIDKQELQPGIDVRELNGQLIVNASPSEHRRVARLMDLLGWPGRARKILAGGAVTAVLILAGMMLHRRRMRRRDRFRGCCLKCGYDLRAHGPGQKCPECGTLIAESATGSFRSS